MDRDGNLSKNEKGLFVAAVALIVILGTASMVERGDPDLAYAIRAYGMTVWLAFCGVYALLRLRNRT